MSSRVPSPSPLMPPASSPNASWALVNDPDSRAGAERWNRESAGFGLENLRN